MNPPSDETDLISWFKHAVQSVLGGWLAWVLICMTGSYAIHAAAGNHSNPAEFFRFIWLWHWILAGLGIWGILLMAVHAMLLRQLILGTDHPLLLLTGMLLNQMTMALGANWMWEDQWQWGPFLCWLVVLALVITQVSTAFVPSADPPER